MQILLFIMKSRILPLQLALVALLQSSALAQIPGNVKNLGYANYSGIDLSNGVSYWLGMHYGAPPVGNLRFAAPQPPIVYPGVNGVVDASQVSASRWTH